MDWYYARNNDRVGPVDEQELARLLSQGEIYGNTLIWKAGMNDWAEIQSLPEFAGLAGGTASPASGPGAALAGSDLVTCAVSGRQVPRDQAVQIGTDYVSAENKALYIQRTREGLMGGASQFHFKYAGFWIRVLAVIIDSIGLCVVFYGFYFGLAAAMQINPFFGPPISFIVATNLFSLAMNLTYYTFFIGKFQATPGKMACGIRVVRSDGTKLTYMRAFGRYWGLFLSGLTCGIGCIMAAFDDEKRALHDHICDTRVVYK